MPFVFSIKDSYRQAVEAATGGKNTVMYDDKGNPSVMVAVPRFNMSDVITGAPNTPHPAFIVNGVTKDIIYISKYPNIVHDNRAYSLPMQDPMASITFDAAVAACNAKGTGWHLTTNAEWAAIALWCKKNGFMPRGNNDFGRDYVATYERARQTTASSGQTNRTATGSGPRSWAHDNSNEGIFDLNGNVWEWVGGMRLVDGEIQIIIDNNAAITGADQSAASPLWKAIAAADGAIVEPGTAGSLKYNGTATIQLTDVITTTASPSTQFQDVAVKAGITIPVIAKALALAPDAPGYDGRGRLYVNNAGERLPSRGGRWNNASNAGVFALRLITPRSLSDTFIGFRSAYVL